MVRAPRCPGAVRLPRPRSPGEPGRGWQRYRAGRPRRAGVRAGGGSTAASAGPGGRGRRRAGPAAGHDAQRRAELRPQPGLHSGRVSGRDDQDRLVRAGVEQGDRGGRAGLSQVAEVIGQLDVAAAPGYGPAARGRRARRRRPPGMRCGRPDGRVLPFGPELLTGPGTGNSGPALHQAVLLETASHGIEVRACHPDCAPPNGPDPTLHASRLRDPHRRLEPVTHLVPHQPPGRSYPVAFTHHEPASIHMTR